MQARLVRDMTAAAIAMIAASACAIEQPDAVRTLAVQPRVVVDGVVELAQRAEQVIVDEVVFHAPDVDVRAPGGVDDLDEGSPLIFRYHARGDGFGDVVGERQWTLIDNGGDLVVGFEPLEATAEMVDALEQLSGVGLEHLIGHTAAVHGYVMMTTSSHGSSSGFSCEGDPDGNPAACKDNGAIGEGDPDGNPSEGDPDGNPAKGEGDPDGNPAKGEGDPDGNPARGEGDPDGNPAHPKNLLDLLASNTGEGDPDGNPSETLESKTQSAQRRQRGMDAGHDVIVDDNRTTYERVPFTLVLNRSFSLKVPVSGLFEGAVDDGEVKPLDLHVALDELMSDELLALLDEEASDDAAGAIVVVLPDASGVGLDVDTEGVAKRTKERVSGGGIRVVGDAR